MLTGQLLIYNVTSKEEILSGKRRIGWRNQAQLTRSDNSCAPAPDAETHIGAGEQVAYRGMGDAQRVGEVCRGEVGIGRRQR